MLRRYVAQRQVVNTPGTAYLGYPQVMAYSLGVTRRIHVIGIGAGDPDYVTAQAVAALNDTQVFFAMDKG